MKKTNKYFPHGKLGRGAFSVPEQQTAVGHAAELQQQMLKCKELNHLGAMARAPLFLVQRSRIKVQPLILRPLLDHPYNCSSKGNPI